MDTYGCSQNNLVRFEVRTSLITKIDVTPVGEVVYLVNVTVHSASCLFGSLSFYSHLNSDNTVKRFTSLHQSHAPTVYDPNFVVS